MDRECGKKKKENGVSVGVRGPVSIHQAVSVSPVEIESMQITKSVNGEVELNEDSTEKDSKKSSDTMGMKHFVRFGLYQIKGSVNFQLAEKTASPRKMPRCPSRRKKCRNRWRSFRDLLWRKFLVYNKNES